MIRSTLRRKLRRLYSALILILTISLIAKFADHVPGLKGTPVLAGLKDAYEFLRDMSLLIATGGVAYITSMFQRRSDFLATMHKGWRQITEAKSAAFRFTQLDQPTEMDYLDAFVRVSETIDDLRILYANVGETDELIGLFPFAPLHDMRRALQTLDPRRNSEIKSEDRRMVRDAILQSFYALRQTFLAELDLEEPDRPRLVFGARRTKRSGATKAARQAQERQRGEQDRLAPADPAIHAFLAALWDKENSTVKPWRTPLQGGTSSTGTSQ